MAVYLWPSGKPRPGLQSSYYLQASNHGTTIQSATLETVVNPIFDLLSVTPAPDEVAGDTLRWHLSDLDYLDTRLFSIVVTLPASIPLGDTVVSTASISPLTGDLIPSNNFARVAEVVVGPYAPNVKVETHNGSITHQAVNSGEPLIYTIHFQNTGTNPVEKVVIADQLDPLLNAGTLQVLAASHPFTWTLRSNGRLEFTFDQIDLPDFMSNQTGSQGLITFAVQVHPQAPIGSTILNNALVYFDLNSPVFTNTVLTQIKNSTGTSAVHTPSLLKRHSLLVLPNPSPAVFTLQWSENIETRQLQVFAKNGQLVWQSQTGTKAFAQVDLGGQPDGAYFAVLTDQQGRYYTATLLLLH